MAELKISHCDIELIQAELEANKPYEACGVLIGTMGDSTIVEKVLPITNVLCTQTSFELDPLQFYDAWNDAEKSSKEIVGIYHTHPFSSAIPSLWDRETMANFASIWLIAGTNGMRAYVWDDGIKIVKIIQM